MEISHLTIPSLLTNYTLPRLLLSKPLNLYAKGMTKIMQYKEAMTDHGGVLYVTDESTNPYLPTKLLLFLHIRESQVSLLVDHDQWVPLYTVFKVCLSSLHRDHTRIIMKGPLTPTCKARDVSCVCGVGVATQIRVCTVQSLVGKIGEDDSSQSYKETADPSL